MTETPPDNSLSDLGGRSEADGKSRQVFRPFEENGRDYLTKRDGKMGRFAAAAVGQSQVRQAVKSQAGRAWPVWAMITKRDRRTILLVLLLNGALAWVAIDSFGVPPQTLAWLLLYCVLGVLAVAALAAFLVAFGIGWRKLRSRWSKR